MCNIQGINCATFKKDDMIKILSQHDDFRDEKTIVESYLLSKGHSVMFFPKFHCEMNSIERVWAQAKRYTRAHCNYSFNGQVPTVDPALDSVDTVLIRKYFRNVRDYITAYREGHVPGRQLEDAVKQYKSHRRVPKDM